MYYACGVYLAQYLYFLTLRLLKGHLYVCQRTGACQLIPPLVVISFSVTVTVSLTTNLTLTLNLTQDRSVILTPRVDISRSHFLKKFIPNPKQNNRFFRQREEL